MNEQEFIQLRGNWLNVERTFDKLVDEKKLNKKQKKEIKIKLELLSYSVMLNNPKLKNNYLKQDLLLKFLRYLKNFNSSSVGISEINSSNSAKSIF